MILHAHQQQVVDEFAGLRPQRAVLAWPTGAGKTAVGVALADRSAKVGPVLVVVPGGSMSAQWADRIRASQREATVVGSRTVTVIDRDALLSALSPGASARQPMVGDVFVVSIERACRPEYADLLRRVAWSLTIIDEVHRLVITTRGRQLLTDLVDGSAGIIVMTATPANVPELDGARRFELPGGVDPGVSESPVREITVKPTEAEFRFVGLVKDWLAASPDEPLRRVALQIALVSPVAAIQVLERAYLARGESTELSIDESIPAIQFGEQTADRELLHDAVDAADDLESLGSKASVLVRLAAGHRQVPALVVCALASDIGPTTEAIQLLRQVELVTVQMEPDERLAAADRMRREDGVLVVSDSVLSAPLARGFHIVYHQDGALSPEDLARRLSIVVEATEPGDSAINFAFAWPFEEEARAVLSPHGERGL